MAENVITLETSGSIKLLNDMISISLIERAHAIHQADYNRRLLVDLGPGSKAYDEAYMAAYRCSLIVGDLSADIEALKRIVRLLEVGR